MLKPFDVLFLAFSEGSLWSTILRSASLMTVSICCNLSQAKGTNHVHIRVWFFVATTLGRFTAFPPSIFLLRCPRQIEWYLVRGVICWRCGVVWVHFVRQVCIEHYLIYVLTEVNFLALSDKWVTNWRVWTWRIWSAVEIWTIWEYGVIRRPRRRTDIAIEVHRSKGRDHFAMLLFCGALCLF